MNTVAPRKIRNASEFGRVGLVIGGDSAERQVSLDGGKAVGAAMARNGVDFSVYDGPSLLFEAINRGEIDRVFNLIHGPLCITYQQLLTIIPIFFSPQNERIQIPSLQRGCLKSD